MNAPAAGERARTAMTGGGHPLIRPLDPRDAHHLADAVRSFRPTTTFLAPVHLQRLLDGSVDPGRDLSSFRLVVTNNIYIFWHFSFL